MSTGWLIDKSALWRMSASPAAAQWGTRIQRGTVRVSTPTLLEIGYSARSTSDWADRVASPPVSLMPLATITPAAENRALEVQRLLALQGHHRAPSVPDLFIAAIAESDDLVVLHLDKDFDLIAEITGQPMERLRMAD